MKKFIDERAVYDGETLSLRLVSYTNEKYNSTIKKNAYFQHDGCTFTILDDHKPGAMFATCVVTCSSSDLVQVGSTEVIHYEVIHREVINFLQSMMDF